MGFFSWITIEGKSISNAFSSRGAFKVYMLDNNNKQYMERAYQGYGIFDNKDVFVLTYEMNTGKKVNVDLMRKSGRIDLTLLNKNLADELMSEYRDNVLKLSDMMAAVGMPGVNRPSANLYRSSYQFSMGELEGTLHPAQIALNRSILNFNMFII